MRTPILRLSTLAVGAIVLFGGMLAEPVVPAGAHGFLAVDEPAPTVVRLAGATRYETAVAISAEFYAPGVDAVYVTRGDDFPDGLAGAPPAAIREPGPILLTRTGSLPAAVIAELNRLQPEKIYVLGGPDVVSDLVLIHLSDWAPTQRIEGQTRYDTAAAISDRFFASWQNGNPYAIIARGDSFADALPGGPLAAQLAGPILLVQPGSIPQSVNEQLDALQLYKKIYILGGTDVVSPAVEAELATRGLPVVRLAGADRYATAAAIYGERLGAWNRVAFVATGLNFPDALAGGAPAGMLNAPLFLVRQDSIPPATVAALATLKPQVIYVLGDSGVVSDAVATELETYMAPIDKVAPWNPFPADGAVLVMTGPIVRPLIEVCVEAPEDAVSIRYETLSGSSWTVPADPDNWMANCAGGFADSLTWKAIAIYPDGDEVASPFWSFTVEFPP